MECCQARGPPPFGPTCCIGVRTRLELNRVGVYCLATAYFDCRRTEVKRATKIRQWISGKPLLLSLTAIQGATVCNILNEFYEILDSDSLQSKLAPLPPVAEWLSMFRDHRRVAIG